MEQNGAGCEDDVSFQVRLAGLYIRANDLPRAETIVEQGLRKHPQAPELLSHRATLAQLRGDFAAAEKQAAVLVQKYPDMPSPRYVLLGIALQKQDWPRALEYGKQVYAVDHNSLTLLTLTAVLHQLGRHEEAIDMVYRALEQDPGLVRRGGGINEAIYSMGSLGRFDEAAKLARRRMAADPDWRSDAAFVSAATRLKIIE